MNAIRGLIICLSFIVLSGCTDEMYRQWLDNAVDFQRWLADWKPNSIVVDGIEVSYLDNEVNSNEVVLFIHGYSANKDNWNRLAYRLDKNQRLIALDLLGHGRTGLDPGNNYLLMNQVQLIHSFLSLMRISKVHLVGNSMGGAVALLFALHHPEQSLSLTLIDSAGVHGLNASPFDQALENGENLLAIKDEASFDRMMSLVFYDPPWIPQGFKNVIIDRAVPNYQHYQFVLSEIMRSGEIWRESGRLYGIMPKLEVPTLLIWGEKDQILDVSSVEVFQQHLPNVQTHIIEESGHVPMIEKPDETAQLITDFIHSGLHERREM